MPDLKTAFTSAATLALALTATPASATEPFLGEIRTFGFNFCPRGWAPADGALLPISSNTALFALFGTTYGGDGRTTFALPDLRGRAEVHQGQGPGLSERQIGELGGQEEVTLTVTELPSHAHDVLIAQTDQAGDNSGLTVSQGSETGFVSGGTGTAGGGRPHDNMPPYVVVNKCVAVEGIFPSRS